MRTLLSETQTSDLRAVTTSSLLVALSLVFFFFNDPATTEIYTLSLHDALPIFLARRAAPCVRSDSRRPDFRRDRRRDQPDRKSTRLNSSHTVISYAVFCLKKKNQRRTRP